MSSYLIHVQYVAEAEWIDCFGFDDSMMQAIVCRAMRIENHQCKRSDNRKDNKHGVVVNFEEGRLESSLFPSLMKSRLAFGFRLLAL